MQLPAVEALENFAATGHKSDENDTLTFCIDSELTTVEVESRNAASDTGTATDEPFRAGQDEWSEEELVKAYGEAMTLVLEKNKIILPRLARIAKDCRNGQIKTLHDLHLRLERRVSAYFFLALIVLLALLLTVLYVFSR